MSVEKLRLTAVLVCLGLSTGCVMVSQVRTGPVLPARPVGSPVQVLTTAPQRPFVEVGIIEAKADSNLSVSQVIESFQRAACELGADAVLLGPQSVAMTSFNSTYTAGQYSATSSMLVRHMATAIAWTGPAASTAVSQGQPPTPEDRAASAGQPAPASL